MNPTEDIKLKFTRLVTAAVSRTLEVELLITRQGASPSSCHVLFTLPALECQEFRLC